MSVLFDKNDLFEHGTTSQTKPFIDITITDTDTNLHMIDVTEFSNLIQSSVHFYTYINYMCMFVIIFNYFYDYRIFYKHFNILYKYYAINTYYPYSNVKYLYNYNTLPI